MPPLKLLDPDAPWNEVGRARLDALMAAASGIKAAGWGSPLMMNGSAPLQFLITPEETLIINFYRDVRHVHTDGRPLLPPEDRWPTVWGESIGRWEGDTLSSKRSPSRSRPATSASRRRCRCTRVARSGCARRAPIASSRR